MAILEWDPMSPQVLADFSCSYRQNWYLQGWEGLLPVPPARRSWDQAPGQAPPTHPLPTQGQQDTEGVPTSEEDPHS